MPEIGLNIICRCAINMQLYELNMQKYAYIETVLVKYANDMLKYAGNMQIYA